MLVFYFYCLARFWKQMQCQTIQRISLRSSSSYRLLIPQHDLSFGSRAFHFSAARIWNSLPICIRESRSLLPFSVISEHFSSHPIALLATHPPTSTIFQHPLVLCNLTYLIFSRYAPTFLFVAGDPLLHQVTQCFEENVPEYYKQQFVGH